MSIIQSLSEYIITANPAGRLYVQGKLRALEAKVAIDSFTPLDCYFAAIGAIYPAGFIALGNPFGFRLFTSGAAKLAMAGKTAYWSVRDDRRCFAQIDAVGYLTVDGKETTSKVFLDPFEGETWEVASNLSDVFKAMTAVAASGILAKKPSHGDVLIAAALYRNVVGANFLAPWPIDK